MHILSYHIISSSLVLDLVLVAVETQYTLWLVNLQCNLLVLLISTVARAHPRGDRRVVQEFRPCSGFERKFRFLNNVNFTGPVRQSPLEVAAEVAADEEGGTTAMAG